LPSPTQMAPNNRELNKYEANKGEIRIRRHEICAFLHGLMPCSPMVRAPGQHVNLPRDCNQEIYGSVACLGAEGWLDENRYVVHPIPVTPSRLANAVSLSCRGN